MALASDIAPEENGDGGPHLQLLLRMHGGGMEGMKEMEGMDGMTHNQLRSKRRYPQCTGQRQ